MPGIWLVGVGTVFLVQQVSGCTWSEAWPLFVIMVGVCGGVTAFLGRRWTRSGIWGLWGPIAVAIIGILLLLALSGTVGTSSSDILRWWPVAVIGLGIWFLIGALVVRDTRTSDYPRRVPHPSARFDRAWRSARPRLTRRVSRARLMAGRQPTMRQPPTGSSSKSRAISERSASPEVASGHPPQRQTRNASTSMRRFVASRFFVPVTLTTSVWTPAVSGESGAHATARVVVLAE